MEKRCQSKLSLRDKLGEQDKPPDSFKVRVSPFEDPMRDKVETGEAERQECKRK